MRNGLNIFTSQLSFDFSESCPRKASVVRITWTVCCGRDWKHFETCSWKSAVLTWLFSFLAKLNYLSNKPKRYPPKLPHSENGERLFLCDAGDFSDREAVTLASYFVVLWVLGSCSEKRLYKLALLCLTGWRHAPVDSRWSGSSELSGGKLSLGARVCSMPCLGMYVMILWVHLCNLWKYIH